MNFEELLDQIKNTALPINMTIPRSWAQGRTIFGGLSAALLYASIRKVVADERVLRSINTNFVGPLVSDEELTIEVEVLREGRSVSQVLARAIQNKQTCVLVQATFGMERESRIKVENEIKHNLPKPEQGTMAATIEGVTPPFLEFLDLSFCSGAPPFSNSPLHNLSGWMRFSDAPNPPKDEHLIALIDAWPPTVLQMFDGFSPASSLTWNLEFIHPHAPLKADSWFAYEAETRQAASGYAHTEANIWNQQNELVAISRQVVVAFQ